MNTKELLKRYNEAFADVMNEQNCLRFRYQAAIRAAALAEVMRDNPRLMNALAVIEHLGKQVTFADGK